MNAKDNIAKLLAYKAEERAYIQRKVRSWLNHPDPEIREFAHRIYKPSADPAPQRNRGTGRKRNGVA